MNRSRTIGVTGLPCTGKSYAAELLASGAITGSVGLLVKADEVGHRVLARSSVRKTITDHFQLTVPGKDDKAFRRAVASVVFTDPEKLNWLEQYIHPLVAETITAWVQQAPDSRPVVIEAALLTAGGLDSVCGTVVVMDSSSAARRRRASIRGWPVDELQRREQRLLPLFTDQALSHLTARIVRVRNDADDGHLDQRLREAFQTIK